MNGGGDFCIARYSYHMSAWCKWWQIKADLLELYCQLRCHVRSKGGYEVGGDLPSFALLSSPSREIFTSLSYLIQMVVLSCLVLMIGVCKISRVISIVIDDDGRCWMITNHPSVYGINSRRVSTIIHYTSTMAGPPEERQKQLIYERERAREAVCKDTLERAEGR